STSVTTDASGNSSLTVSFPVATTASDSITATATDPAGNTSELSAAYQLSGQGSVNPSSWTPIGPAPVMPGWWAYSFAGWEGRVNDVAVDPTSPSTIFLAAALGGVWKTTDDGTHWTPLTDHLMDDSTGSSVTLDMGAVAIDPINPQIVYAGRGDADGPGGT